MENWSGSLESMAVNYQYTISQNTMYDFAIVGGGIVGLSTVMTLSRVYPDAQI